MLIDMKHVYCKNKLRGLTPHCCAVHVLVEIEFKFFATSLNAQKKGVTRIRM